MKYISLFNTSPHRCQTGQVRKLGRGSESRGSAHTAGRWQGRSGRSADCRLPVAASLHPPVLGALPWHGLLASFGHRDRQKPGKAPACFCISSNPDSTVRSSPGSSASERTDTRSVPSKAILDRPGGVPCQMTSDAGLADAAQISRTAEVAREPWQIRKRFYRKPLSLGTTRHAAITNPHGAILWLTISAISTTPLPLAGPQRTLR